MKRRLFISALCLVAICVFAGSASAVKLKPVAYGYSQCTSKTKCTYTAITNPKGTTLQFLFDAQACPLASQALAQAKVPKVSASGKFKTTATYTGVDGKDNLNHDLSVTVSGKLKKKASVKGTVKVTTDAPTCSGVAGKTIKYHLKYKGPIYGG